MLRYRLPIPVPQLDPNREGLTLARRRVANISMALLAAALSGCAATKTCYESETPEKPLRSIYVVKRGWHTGVAIATADWPNRSWPLLDEFADVHYVEFGWGDERFYKAERNTSWLGLRAALWPSSSVIHVIGLRRPIADDAAADSIIEVHVSSNGLRDLTRSIETEFSGTRPVPIGKPLSAGPEPNRFYTAKRPFYFPRMCNWWVARHLHEAGCPIAPWSVVSASRVMREARQFAD
jgi:hypothetical protein